MTRVREEETSDRKAVYQINEAAFGRPEEANLVNALRANGAATISLVAEEGGVCVGHVLFSPVVIHKDEGIAEGIGLAPLAVLPAHQGKGVGSLLVREGLARCRQLGWGFVVVLGEPAYYARFGFVPARGFGIRCEYDLPDEDAFMVMELQPGALTGQGGQVKYRKEFSEVA